MERVQGEGVGLARSKTKYQRSKMLVRLPVLFSTRKEISNDEFLISKKQ